MSKLGNTNDNKILSAEDIADGSITRGKLSATALDGYFGRNVVVNADVSISQINAGSVTPVLASGHWPIDNIFYAAQAGVLTAQQVTTRLRSLGAVTAIESALVATGTSVAVNNYYKKLGIEGLNFSRFGYGTANAKAGSLQFKFFTNVAGTYSGAIQNYAQNRSYPFSFTISAGEIAAGGKLVKIENIPGDTGGAWVGNTNAGACIIVFHLGSPAIFKSTAGTWQGADYRGVTGAADFVTGTTGDVHVVTDLQFEVGAFCTEFERKLFDQNLRECMRYYEDLTIGAHYLAGVATTYAIVSEGFLVRKRTDPTLTSAVQYYSNGTPTNFTPSPLNGFETHVNFSLNGAINWTGFAGGHIYASARI